MPDILGNSEVFFFSPRELVTLFYYSLCEEDLNISRTYFQHSNFPYSKFSWLSVRFKSSGFKCYNIGDLSATFIAVGSGNKLKIRRKEGAEVGSIVCIDPIYILRYEEN